MTLLTFGRLGRVWGLSRLMQRIQVPGSGFGTNGFLDSVASNINKFLLHPPACSFLRPITKNVSNISLGLYYGTN